MGRLNIFSYGDVALQNGIKKAHEFNTLIKIRFERLKKCIHHTALLHLCTIMHLTIIKADG